MKNHQFALTAIESCKVFDELSTEEKGVLAVVAEVIEYAKGTKVFSMDQAEDNHFYILCSGRLSLTLKGRKGLKKELSKGDLFGEIAVFSDRHRLGTIECLEDAVLLEFDYDKVFNRELISAQAALKICLILTKKIANYFYKDGDLTAKELMKMGESETIEYKKALNENKFEIIQTMVAFMNQSGGSILIGIEDDGKPRGIPLPHDKAARNQKRDEYTRMILDAAKSRMDLHSLSLVKVDWENVDGHFIMKIDCPPANSPVFYKNFIGKEAKEVRECYYLRTGPRNNKLTQPSEFFPLVMERFK